MRFCISFGKFGLKYFLYCVLFAISDIYVILFIYLFDKNNNAIFNKHILLDSLCFYLGYLLNFIPAWIMHKNSKTRKSNGLIESKPESIKYIYNKTIVRYLSTKDIIIFFGFCLILLLLEFIEVILNKITKNKQQYVDDYLLFKFLIVFILPKYFSEVFYKHQNISIIFFILIEIIKIYKR